MVFWDPEVDVGSPAPFQLILSSQHNVSLSSIPFTSLAIHFNADVPPVVVRHSQTDPDAEVPSVQRFDLGQIQLVPASPDTHEVEAALRWGAGSTIVFTGSVSSGTPTQISVRPLRSTPSE